MKKILFLFFLLAGYLQADPETFTVDGPCTVTFSPKGGTTKAIIQLMGSAKKTIRVLAYSFASKPIGKALVDAKKRGVDVQLVLDKSIKSEKGNLLSLMLDAKIPTWIDRKHQIAHNKVIIVDGKIFETGSFNFTGSAEHSNAENAVICPSISGAAIFIQNWEIHKNHSVIAD
jgi:phosphatidylserine/phosphatidylglycerophosphate/cardiolipin synthase-like enzyme